MKEAAQEISGLNRPSSVRVLVNETETEREARRRLKGDRSGVDPLSMEGFLFDFAEARVENMLLAVRARSEPDYVELKKDRLDEIFAPQFPQHTAIHRDALQGIGVYKTSHYTEIDSACDAICCAVSLRLERSLTARYFKSRGQAKEALDVPGLGRISVVIDRTGDGVFTSIGAIEGEDFRINNCRFTGRRYLGQWNDISAPNEITIAPLKVKLTLYEDTSGIYLEKNGIRYTNARVKVFGVGYSSDYLLDELLPQRENFEERSTNSSLKVAAKEFAARLKSAVTPQSGRSSYSSVMDFARAETVDLYRDFLHSLGMPFQLSFKEEQAAIVKWLREEVLAKILATPENNAQLNTPPATIPCPEQFRALYAWVDEETKEKILLTGERNDNLNVDSREAISPNLRLVPLGGAKGGIPEEAECGMIWCGIGNVPHHAKARHYDSCDLRDSGSSFNSRRYLVQIYPSDARELYVVDYGEHHNDYKAAKTLVPITEYKGGYSNPVVVSARPFQFDEVELVRGVVKGEKR